jgi:Tol biopolymer transport system component
MMPTVRKLGAVTVVAMTMMLAACTTSTAGPAGVVMESSSTVPTVNRAAFSAQGKLAFISEGGLWVLDGETTKLTEVAPFSQQATDPQFSPNGSWLCYSLVSGEVWLARSDGDSPRAVATGGGGSWFPDGELVAGTGLWRVSSTGTVTRVGTTPSALVAWSSDGARYAFVSDSLSFTKASTGVDRLEVSSSLTGRRTTWYGSRVSFNKSSGAQGGFLDRVVVLPHRQGIVFTLDPDRSASLAADGLNLYEISGPGEQPKRLGTTVGDTVAVGSDGTFAFTDGPNRYAWLTKTAETCLAATELCTRVSTPSGKLSFGPAWSPSGKVLAFVEAPSSSTGNFFQSALERWYATHSLWVLRSGSSSPVEVKSVDGASVPVWSADGKSLLYEANDALWFLPTLSSKPVRIVSPLFATNDWPSQYGQVDWSGQFAWLS